MKNIYVKTKIITNSNKPEGKHTITHLLLGESAADSSGLLSSEVNRHILLVGELLSQLCSNMYKEINKTTTNKF
jgi:hypothetical protein